MGLRELGQDFCPRVHPFPTIPTRSSSHNALVKRFMDINKKTMGKEDFGASREAEGWQDLLQLLREPIEKMEVLARALRVIQQGMLINNTGPVKDSKNEATEESKIPQLDLGRVNEAWDLLMQTARERGADVLLISGRDKWSENSAWYQDASRRTGILVCRPDLSIRDFQEIVAGFVWMEVAGVRVYSCYFSPNDPFEIFETQFLLLEDSLREAGGRSLIAGNFNSKSPEWVVAVWTGGESWSVRWLPEMI